MLVDRGAPCAFFFKKIPWNLLNKLLKCWNRDSLVNSKSNPNRNPGILLLISVGPRFPAYYASAYIHLVPSFDPRASRSTGPRGPSTSVPRTGVLTRLSVVPKGFPAVRAIVTIELIFVAQEVIPTHIFLLHFFPGSKQGVRSAMVCCVCVFVFFWGGCF